MDWKVMGAAFIAVFFAELADKTQLVGIGLASKSLKPFSVFIGSVLAYSLITILSVFVSAAVGKHIRPEYVRVIGGTLFVLMGILMFFDRS